MQPKWIIGMAARIDVAIADGITSAPLDPPVLRLKVKSPAGTITTTTYPGSTDIVRDAAGSYHANVALTEAGYWFWRWETDAPNIGADDGALNVERGRFT
jgi:hypothetical protein